MKVNVRVPKVKTKDPTLEVLKKVILEYISNWADLKLEYIAKGDEDEYEIEYQVIIKGFKSLAKMDIPNVLFDKVSGVDFDLSDWYYHDHELTLFYIYQKKEVGEE